jgi:gluconolactonase
MLTTRFVGATCVLSSLFAGASFAADTETTEPVESMVGKTIGSVERLHERMDKLVPADAKIEVLAEGFVWTEGPVWAPQHNFLLFSDIPPNSIFRWKEGAGCQLYLKPSGFTGIIPRAGESGSNGLVLDEAGRLVLCQHGDRRVARCRRALHDDAKPRADDSTAPIEDTKETIYETLADRYDGKRLNSPNDLCFHSKGDLYFTDPPYGLEKGMDDPGKELDFQGVYRLSKDGKVTLLTKELSRPNGIAFSPDEKTLYVANSDPKRAIWMAFPVKDDGTLAEGRVFYDVTDQVGKRKGLPDGLKVDKRGNLFATGPGGVLVFTPRGKHLGTILTTQATSNCAFGDDGKTLYITADMYLLRIKLGTTGMGFRPVPRTPTAPECRNRLFSVRSGRSLRSSGSGRSAYR